jgi:hypothetical protein
MFSAIYILLSMIHLLDKICIITGASLGLDNYLGWAAKL